MIPDETYSPASGGGFFVPRGHGQDVDDYGSHGASVGTGMSILAYAPMAPDSAG
jgi:hypothetical protein